MSDSSWNRVLRPLTGGGDVRPTNVYAGHNKGAGSAVLGRVVFGVSGDELGLFGGEVGELAVQRLVGVGVLVEECLPCGARGPAVSSASWERSVPR